MSGRTLSCVAAGLAGALITLTLAAVVLPRALNLHSVVVLTGSMEPALPAGSVAFVDPDIDGAALMPGDVATYRNQDGAIVTHRIQARFVEESGVRYQTMGDANLAPDRMPVRPADIQGKVVAVIPQLGSWSQWLAARANLQTVVWPIVILIVVNEMWALAGESPQLQRQRRLHGDR